MYDGASLSEQHQRAKGDCLVAAKRRGAESVLDRLRQAGCLKLRFPRPLTAGWLDATMVNTSGGVAGGDQLETTVFAGPSARLTITAQAAERFYRALPDSGPSVVRTAIGVGADATVEWLPQETILFEQSALDRSLTVDLASDSRFLSVETLVFGRAAMGERVMTTRLSDRIQIRRGGALLLHDAIRIIGESDALLAKPWIADGARVVTTLVYVAPDAEARLDAIRAAGDFAASAWNGMLVARLLSPDSAAMRDHVTALLAILRDGRPLPRAWLC